ncbi:hypothetical protein ABLN64_03575 [Mycobacterium tuberculosis]
MYLENAAGPEPDTKRAEGRRFGAFGGGDLRWMADRVPRQGSGRRGLGEASEGAFHDKCENSHEYGSRSG